MNPIVKRFVVAIPFVAMLVDIFSWYITKAVPSFAYVVVISGALMGLAMGAQIFVSLFQMWFISTTPQTPRPHFIQIAVDRRRPGMPEFLTNRSTKNR